MVREELVKNAIKCFHELRSPFDHEELCRMEVTASECFDLSNKVASDMEFILWLKRRGLYDNLHFSMLREMAAEIAIEVFAKAQDRQREAER